MPQLFYANSLLGEIGSSFVEVSRAVSARHNPWQVSISVVTTSIGDVSSMSFVALLAQLRDLRETFNDHLFIATDGSVVGAKLGVGIYIPELDVPFSVRPPDHTPIYDAELIAIILALPRLLPSINKVLMVSYSLSMVSELGTEQDYPYYSLRLEFLTALLLL